MGSFFRNLFRSAGGEVHPSAREAPPAPPTADPRVAERLARALVTIAVETWRMRARLAKLDDSQRSALRVLETSLDKTGDALSSLGLRVHDPVGQSWDERDPEKVLLFEEAEGTTKPRVVEVVKPTLYLGETLLAPGEVVVAVPRGDARAADGQGRQ